MRRLPPLSTYRFKSSIYEGAKWSLGQAMTKRLAFLIFSKSMTSLLSPICLRGGLPGCFIFYLVHAFVLGDEFLEVGGEVAALLLARVEYHLNTPRSTTFCTLIFKLIFK